MSTNDMMADFDHDEYNSLLEWARSEGIHLCHSFDKFEGSPKGGVTIAYRSTKPEYRRNRMYEVAVAYCSPKDTFCKKIGNFLALLEFEAGHVITIPAGIMGDELAVAHIKGMFRRLL